MILMVVVVVFLLVRLKHLKGLLKIFTHICVKPENFKVINYRVFSVK